MHKGYKNTHTHTDTERHLTPCPLYGYPLLPPLTTPCVSFTPPPPVHLFCLVVSGQGCYPSRPWGQLTGSVFVCVCVCVCVTCADICGFVNVVLWFFHLKTDCRSDSCTHRTRQHSLTHTKTHTHTPVPAQWSGKIDDEKF